MKKGDLLPENLVEVAIFAGMFILVIIILVTWWIGYNSQQNIPVIRSLESIQKSVKSLDPEFKSLTRAVPIQTNDYVIKGSSNPNLCGSEDGAALHCLCACKKPGCVNVEENPKKYCRVVPYKPLNIEIDTNDMVLNYILRLSGEDENLQLTITLS